MARRKQSDPLTKSEAKKLKQKQQEMRRDVEADQGRPLTAMEAADMYRLMEEDFRRRR